MAEFQERNIDLQGFQIAFKVWHKKTKRPVLCLHGKSDNAASFDLLAPLLPNAHLLAVDYPGTGNSSWYPKGVIPYWKNDAFLLVHLIKTLGWKEFDIIAHSLGSLLASVIAIALPTQVENIVFLDILGPKVNFVEESAGYLRKNVEAYLESNRHQPKTFPDLESAIYNRMKIGKISYQAAQALARRGVKRGERGWFWALDPRLDYVASTIPYEDELKHMFKAIEANVCLIRASQGIRYPIFVFQQRAEAIRSLTTFQVEGGHHVHMDDPSSVANIISKFLRC